jgi:hypothetical protein
VVASHGGTSIGTYIAAPRSEVARRVLSLPPRLAGLAGREELLARLHALLTEGDRPRTVVLSGLGGVGKTSIAAEYAHRHLGEVGISWQVGAEDPLVLTAGLAELAAQLDAAQPGDSRDPVALVHGVLAAFPAEWLLVFDNAPDDASVWRFLPPAGQGRVLVTSQSQHWPAEWVLDVRVLDDEVATEFLLARTASTDRAAARALAGELGGLPLALEQAAGYIRATATSLSGYLTLFRDRRATLLDRGKSAGYRQTVAATLALALTRLEAEAAAAAGLLRLLSCLAPEPAPLELLLSHADAVGEPDPEVAPVLAMLADRIAAGDAVDALRRYSLITPAGDGLVLVHRLVQAVTLAQTPAPLVAGWRKAAAELVEAGIPADIEPPQAIWPAFASLLPHAQAALATQSNGLARIASYLGYRGSYRDARDLQLRIVEAREQARGPEHADTLTARHKLAWLTGYAGDEPAARDQFAALVSASERALGPEDPVTLRARDELAHWTGNLGDAAAARDMYAAMLPAYERVLGAEHPDTLTIRGGLADYTADAGDPAAARDQLTALLPVRERVSGPEHNMSLNVRNDLANATGRAGDPAAARDQFAALLPAYDRVLGPEHPGTLSARNSLARWTGHAGDPAGARDQYLVVVPAYERVLGPEQPRTLNARRELAYWTGRAGDAAGARDQLAALLPIRERVLGTEHPDTLATRQYLAYWTREAAAPPRQPSGEPSSADAGQHEA